MRAVSSLLMFWGFRSSRLLLGWDSLISDRAATALATTYGLNVGVVDERMACLQQCYWDATHLR